MQEDDLTARSRLTPIELVFSNYSRLARSLASFPTRRSSDLLEAGLGPEPLMHVAGDQRVGRDRALLLEVGHRDRKSIRLNSSHMSISYAVFCLKKKKSNWAIGLSKERA